MVRRYAFRSTEKVALQEIGPRFTLKLRSLRKGLPAVTDFAEPQKPLEFDDFGEGAEDGGGGGEAAAGDGQMDGRGGEAQAGVPQSQGPSTTEEYLWMWKVRARVGLSWQMGVLIEVFV